MTPTPAQIEAVIKAIADIDHYDGEGHGLCMTGYEEIARAVLTAAAQVGEHNEATAETIKEKLADLIGMPNTPEVRKTICDRLTAAAQVGETFDDGYKYKEAECRDEIIVVIERCAQVAEKWGKEVGAEYDGNEIAAAIRELKDET